MADAVRLRVRITPDDLDGGYIAECIDLPGCMSEGDTEAEALHNLTEAITGVLAVRIERSMSQHRDEREFELTA